LSKHNSQAPTGNFQLYHVNSEYQSIVSKNLATLQEIREGVWDYAQVIFRAWSPLAVISISLDLLHPEKKTSRKGFYYHNERRVAKKGNAFSPPEVCRGESDNL
jgi:hypothetical protein